MIVANPTHKPKRRFGRKELHAQARAAVLGGIALFILVQLAMRGWIELRRPDMRDPSFEIKYLAFERLLQQTDSPAVIAFFGSSMTAHGVKADLIEAPLTEALGKPVVGFNFATSGGGPFTQHIYLQRLVRRGIRPTLAVVELSPLMYDTSALRDMPRFPAYVLDRYDRETVARRTTEPGFREDWWQAFLVPVYGHRLAILNQSADLFVPFADRLELWNDMDDHGWRRLEPLPSEEKARELAQVEARFAKRFGQYQIAPPNIKDLRDLIAFLAAERIPTILVQMPIAPSLRSLYGKESMTPLFEEFETLSKQSGFALIDAQALCGEDKFIDPVHMNWMGAEELTRHLLREAILPMHRR